jgi:hypothetical protein
MTKGYQVLEDDMTMSLDDFAIKFGRADGEPEYAPTCPPPARCTAR